MELEVRIERLGAQGDGVAQGPDGPLYVPFTLPGELVRVAANGSPGRASCRYRAEPGPRRAGLPSFRGLRRLRPPAHGGDTPISPGSASRSLPPSRRAGSRRRSSRCARCRSRAAAARASLSGAGRKASLSAFAPRAPTTSSMSTPARCSRPRIASALPRLKPMLAPLLGGRREMQIMVTEADNGLDVVIEGGRVSPHQVSALAASAEALGIVRHHHRRRHRPACSPSQWSRSQARALGCRRAPSSRPRARRRTCSSLWCGRARKGR